MSSKREEEKNEKIIRGLMKLPPNRRCINCNSLGPQYVCPNFWTFICTTCSGIHREFTHRVKSVSMAKFSAQEVDALQRGGNQRAREIYLKEWDAQQQFLPSSSNVERIREFIKSVYVDKKYTGARTSDKPPRDTSGRKHNDEEGRRASSYHSYSQSPPYDHQYEERRYGKPAAMLTRPGSERLHYEGKLSSFFDSPGRLSDQVLYEDRFANEGSGMKVLEHSVSGGSDRSDHLRYDAQSPNFRKDVGYGSPTGQPTRDMVAYEMQMQRTSSTGSSVFSDSHSTSFNTMSSTDVSVENQVQHGHLQEAHPALVTGRDSTPFSPPIDLFANFNQQQQPPPTSAPAIGSNLVSHSLSSASTPSVDLFAVASQQHLPSTSAPVGLTYNPPVDLFANANQQLPHPSTAVDLFSNSSQQNIPSTSSVDLFAVTNKQVMVSTIPKDFVANFDQQQAYSVPSRQELPSNNFTQSNGWATFDSPTQSITRPAAADVYQTQPSIAGTSTWCDFGNNMQLSYANITQQAEPRGSTEDFITSSNQMWEASGNAALQNFVNAVPQVTVVDDKATLAGLPAGSVAVDFSLPPQVAPAFVGGVQSDVQIQKSTNPFDLPYEPDVGTSKMFLDMSSLQAALPSSQLPNAFMGGLNPAWFPASPVPSYVPTVAQGSLIYMGGQAPPPQLSNVNSQGPVASLGNPFA